MPDHVSSWSLSSRVASLPVVAYWKKNRSREETVMVRWELNTTLQLQICHGWSNTPRYYMCEYSNTFAFFLCVNTFFFFCSRVVAKAKVEKCPSHSSVCSEFWGWSNCSAKEKAFEPSSGLLSSPSRSVQRRVRNSHHAKGFLQYVHSRTPLFYSPQALPYVGLLIAMIFFIYAVIGMQVSLSSIGAFKWFSSHQMEFIN